MAVDLTYLGGVIAVKETSLLGDRLIKLCSLTAKEAVRALSEYGFARGAEADSEHGYDTLLAADERDIDEFVREYAPNNGISEYFLTPRDFHNAKALVKAEYLGISVDGMLAEDGLIPAAVLKEIVKNGGEGANEELKSAIAQSKALFFDEEGEKRAVSGAEIGVIFERALYKRLMRVCGGVLKKFVKTRADMTNILIAVRAQTLEYAADNYLPFGNLDKETLDKLFDGDSDKAAHALDGTPYPKFLNTCLKGDIKCAEREISALEVEYFKEHRFDLKRSEPFLYYVLRRRAENADVRIIISCLIAGMSEREIASRLRSVL